METRSLSYFGLKNCLENRVKILMLSHRLMGNRNPGLARFRLFSRRPAGNLHSARIRTST